MDAEFHPRSINAREAFLRACSEAQAAGDLALARAANRAAAELLGGEVTPIPERTDACDI